MRRLLDFALCAIGLAVLSLPFVAIVAAIKLADAGPVFYRARRVGLNGNMFLL
jgi:lipopolysaccharide/colanic/teichoic acid biosynthesis glycosyltransferase